MSKFANKMTPNGRALIEYTGFYDMDNKARYLWYAFEHSFISKLDVFPHVFLTSINEEFLQTYKKAFTKELSKETKEFLMTFDYIFCYTENAEPQMINLGFKKLATIENSELLNFDIKNIIIWKKGL